MSGDIGAGHFAGTSGLAFSVASVAAAGADHGGFGDMEAAACRDLDAGGGKFVPAAELGEGDAEAVGDGDQGVAAAGGVVDGVRRGGGSRGDGHDERLDAVELGGLIQLIGFGERRNRDAVGVGDGGESVVGRDLVIAPRVALAFGDGGDLFLEESGGAGGQVQVELGVGRRDEAQQARVQSDELVDRSADNVGDQTQVGGVVDGHRIGERPAGRA